MEGQRKVFTLHPYFGFDNSGYEAAGHNNFLRCFSWVQSPFQRSTITLSSFRVPQFCPNHANFSQFTPIFTQIYISLVLFTPIISVSTFPTTLLTPGFCFFFCLFAT